MKYLYIGWCNEGNSDKVWGIILLKEGVSGYFGGPDPRGELPEYQFPKFLTFWGRRGGKLQTKIWQGTNSSARYEFEKKLDKGYRQVFKEQLNEVYPEFEQTLEKSAVWALMAD